MIDLFLILCLLIFILFLMFRNNQVFSFRNRIIDSLPSGNSFYEYLEEYNNLPEYSTMVMQFWIWPLKNYIKGTKLEKLL